LGDWQHELPTEVPHDSDGDALRRLKADGSDLSRPMEIDFAVLIPDESAGVEYAAIVEPMGFRTDVSYDTETNSWTCYCTCEMAPAYSALIEVQSKLDSLARPLGGTIDGWGSFGNAESQS
jgi:hypothetical protein